MVRPSLRCKKKKNDFSKFKLYLIIGKDAVGWFYKWRTFYIAVAEMFKYNNGNEWFVAHYLFEKRSQ